MNYVIVFINLITDNQKQKYEVCVTSVNYAIINYYMKCFRI